MFYLSKGEQVALFLLLALLLSGAGLLTYQRGVQAGRPRAMGPLFTEAPPRAVALPAAAEAVPPAMAAEDPSPEAPRPEPIPVAGPRTRSRTAPPAANHPRMISLNRASASDLEALPGIGPVLAGRIIQHRERLKKETGRGFAGVDELLNVPGIGPKRLAAIRDQVVP